jgi:hypothetical protein
MQSVEETKAVLEKEVAEQESKTKETPAKNGESNVSETSLQTSSSVDNQVGGSVSTARKFGSDGRLDPYASREKLSFLSIPTNQTSAPRNS